MNRAKAEGLDLLREDGVKFDRISSLCRLTWGIKGEKVTFSQSFEVF